LFPILLFLLLFMLLLMLGVGGVGGVVAAVAAVAAVSVQAVVLMRAIVGTPEKRGMQIFFLACHDQMMNHKFRSYC
jgi:hypothetical protein